MLTLNNQREYFKNLDFLRFIFAIIIIIIFHMSRIACVDINSMPLFNEILIQTDNMNKIVECFFILSGFMLIISNVKDKNFIPFILSKFFRLSPTIIFCVFIFLILSFFKISKFYFFNNIFSIFFLNGLEIGTNRSVFGSFGNVHSSWYVSVLIWVSLLYKYILKIYGEKCFNFIVPCIIISSIWINNNNFYTIIPGTILRGLYAIGIGCMLGVLYKNNCNFIKNSYNSPKAKFIFTLLEVSTFIYFILTICIAKIEKLSVSEFMFLFSIILFTFVIKKGLLSKLCNQTCLAYLGKFSYSIFISHCILLDVFRKYVFTTNFMAKCTNPGFIFVFSIICCIAFGIVTYFLIEKPCYQFYKNFLIRKENNI